MLKVTVHSAENCKSNINNKEAEMSLYCAISVNDYGHLVVKNPKSLETKKVGNTFNPVWRETLCFHLEADRILQKGPEYRDFKLTFNIYNKNKLTAAEFASVDFKGSTDSSLRLYSTIESNKNNALGKTKLTFEAWLEVPGLSTCSGREGSAGMGMNMGGHNICNQVAHSSSGSGANQGMSSGFSHGMKQGIDSGMNHAGVNQGMNHGMHPGVNPGMNYPGMNHPECVHRE